MTEETTNMNRVPDQIGENTTARDALFSSGPQQKDETPSPLQQDIATILKEVQLPERHPFKAEADSTLTPKPHTSLEVNVPQHLQQTPPTGTVTENKIPHNPEQPTEIIRPLRTYKEDVQELVREKKMSLVRAAALESDKVQPQRAQVEEEIQAQSNRTRRHTGIIAAIITLVGIGMLALGAVLFVEGQRASDVSVPQETTLMFAEQTATIAIDDLSPREIKLLLAQARDQANVTLGAITRIAPTLAVPATETGQAGTLRLVTASEFLDAIGSHAPAELARAFGEDFFLGIHAVDHVAPVMVFTVTSYERAFAAMLNWEQNISDGLAPLYPAVLQQSIAQGDTVMTTKFEDGIIRNFDVRVLKDSNGTVKILYAFPTRNILIIAESPYSFVEALSRLQAERRLE